MQYTYTNTIPVLPFYTFVVSCHWRLGDLHLYVIDFKRKMFHKGIHNLQDAIDL